MSETDVFSALNVGSGLNTTELIKNLITAERAPKEKKINDKIEKNEISISAIAELKKSIDELHEKNEAKPLRGGAALTSLAALAAHLRGC